MIKEREARKGRDSFTFKDLESQLHLLTEDIKSTRTRRQKTPREDQKSGFSSYHGSNVQRKRETVAPNAYKPLPPLSEDSVSVGGAVTKGDEEGAPGNEDKEKGWERRRVGLGVLEDGDAYDADTEK